MSERDGRSETHTYDAVGVVVRDHDAQPPIDAVTRLERRTEWLSRHIVVTLLLVALAFALLAFSFAERAL